MYKVKCSIVPIGKRRDGGTRYWCMAHKADATAKYGRPADNCRYAHVEPIADADVLRIDLAKYRGGVALWGAVPPVYDTTDLPLDRGIHVHARAEAGARKLIDQTARKVIVTDSGLDGCSQAVITELDAIYFMVSSIFGFTTKTIACPYCGYLHLDRDWFSIHPHVRHLCAGCGRYFRDSEIAIGNPASLARAIFNTSRRSPRLARKKKRVRQRDFRGGLRIWSSNPAILWTNDTPEQTGIHVHAFGSRREPEIDETFHSVSIDGLDLNQRMLCTLMAQSALPHISGRVVNLICEGCDHPHFDSGAASAIPLATRTCNECGRKITHAGRLRKVIGNPLLGVLEDLAKHSLTPRVFHPLGLIPETI